MGIQKRATTRRFERQAFVSLVFLVVLLVSLYGYLVAVRKAGKSITDGAESWEVLGGQVEDTGAIFDTIRHIELDLIGGINYRMERLRLEERGLELEHKGDPEIRARIQADQAELQAQYDGQTAELAGLYAGLNAATYVVRLADGTEHEFPVAKVVRAYRPNEMTLPGKVRFYAAKLWEFITDEPREANTV